jgi:hypothetical protein
MSSRHIVLNLPYFDNVDLLLGYSAANECRVPILLIEFNLQDPIQLTARLVPIGYYKTPKTFQQGKKTCLQRGSTSYAGVKHCKLFQQNSLSRSVLSLMKSSPVSAIHLPLSKTHT